MKRDILIASTAVIIATIIGLSSYCCIKAKIMQHKEAKLTEKEVTNYKSLHPYNHCLIVMFSQSRKNGEILKSEQAITSCEKLLKSRIKTEKD